MAVERKHSFTVNGDPLAAISELVAGITGVQLGPRQRVMVESRVRKRMSELGFAELDQYVRHFEMNRESETAALVSLLTTHHTYFFREFAHFQHLETSGLKRVVDAARARGERKIRVWSAACSRGQEVYTISMFLAYHLPRIAPEFTYEILGSDVDSDSVSVAQNGVYPFKEIKEIPLHYQSGHWTRGTGEIAEYVKAKGTIKGACTFRVVNLLGFLKENLGEFDIIFCRNVFIYFEAGQIKEVTARLLRCLRPQGLLFIGISESLTGLGLPASLQGPSIYSHPAPVSEPVVPAAAPAAPALVPREKILRVLCVDDSSTVLTLLRKILSKEAGFEVVGTAANGLEAAAFLKKNEVDLVTLDIHMPEQDGLEYLKKNHSDRHPPVVVISSVARENADLAISCLQAGAADYIEKPALNNLAERGDEIRMKLQCAYWNGTSSRGAIGPSVERSFARPLAIRDPQAKLRLIFAGISDEAKLKAFFGELKGPQPPTVIMIEGAGGALNAFSEHLKGRVGARIEHLGQLTGALEPDKVYLGDLARVHDALLRAHSSKRASILVYGLATERMAGIVCQWTGSQLLVEDLRTVGGRNRLGEVATDVVPATSFAYLSTEFLGRDDG